MAERANRTCYGLGAGVITDDINKAITLAHTLQAGSVWSVIVLLTPVFKVWTLLCLVCLLDF